MIVPRNPVPDLLKRFVRTPYKLIAKGAIVETNDLDLLEQFEIGIGSAKLATVAPNFRIRVVRDPEAPTGSRQVHNYSSEAMCVLQVGEGTVIMVDLEERRVFAFLASDISNEQFAHLYLPLAVSQARQSAEANAIGTVTGMSLCPAQP